MIFQLFYFNVQGSAITKIMTTYVHFEDFIFDGPDKFINNNPENFPIRSKAEKTFELSRIFEQDEVGTYNDMDLSKQFSCLVGSSKNYETVSNEGLHSLG